jgi:hypothetical protein
MQNSLVSHKQDNTGSGKLPLVITSKQPLFTKRVSISTAQKSQLNNFYIKLIVTHLPVQRHERDSGKAESGQLVELANL